MPFEKQVRAQDGIFATCCEQSGELLAALTGTQVDGPWANEPLAPDTNDPPALALLGVGVAVTFGADEVVNGAAVVFAEGAADDVTLAGADVGAASPADVTQAHTEFAEALAARAVGIPQLLTTQFKASELIDAD
jgi:hypothetical protein